MPTLAEALPNEGASPLRILALGRPGGGKTGALASLANAGYMLRIADFDNAARSILLQYVKPEARQNVDIRVYVDKLRSLNDIIQCDGIPKAVESFTRDLDTWDGGLNKWPPNEVFVIDTLTFFGLAWLRRVMFLNGVDGKRREPSHYGLAMDKIEGLFERFKFSGLRCAVICNTHITYQSPATGTRPLDMDLRSKEEKAAKPDDDLKIAGGSGDEAIGLPIVLGRALPPKAGAFFNVQLYMRSTGGGKRAIYTIPMDGVETKIPATVPASLDITTGLEKVFSAMGRNPTTLA